MPTQSRPLTTDATMDDLAEACRQVLGRNYHCPNAPELTHEGLSRMYEYGLPGRPAVTGNTRIEDIPRWRWLAVYAVEGANEGHYVHVDLILNGENYGPHQVYSLFLVKTFAGKDVAIEIARRLATVLPI